MDDSAQLRAIEQIFSELFSTPYKTHITGGADEPFYRAAATSQDCHLLYYRGDYPASALHEIAHWCIAGEQRRQLDDFGYWYEPGERSAERQRQFETAEVAPQALEWLFSRACGRCFQLSVDNFALDNRPPTYFVKAVFHQLQEWLVTKTLPKRGALFADNLAKQMLPAAQVQRLMDSRAYTLQDLLVEECVA